MTREHARKHFWRVEAIDRRRLNLAIAVHAAKDSYGFYQEALAQEPRLIRLNAANATYRMAGYYVPVRP